MDNKSFIITQPTRIHFGKGLIQTLPEIINSTGAEKPLLVIDPGLVQAGLDKTISAPLDKAGVK